jgi:formylmethanofuran dehydrogenase subunit E
MTDERTDEKILGVWRVADLSVPKSGSVRGHYCSECREEVWLMPRNLTLGLRLLCLRCAETKDELTVLPAEVAHLQKFQENADNN